jgi:hypothetical protein
MLKVRKKRHAEEQEPFWFFSANRGPGDVRVFKVRSKGLLKG